MSSGRVMLFSQAAHSHAQSRRRSTPTRGSIWTLSRPVRQGEGRGGERGGATVATDQDDFLAERDANEAKRDERRKST